MRILTSLLGSAVLSASAGACATSTPRAQSTSAPRTERTPAISAEAATGPAHLAVAPSMALQRRAEDVMRFINGEGDPLRIFTPGALSKVPAERLTAVASTVRRKYGNALGIARIEALTPNNGRVFITFEQTQLVVKLGIEGADPNRVYELLFVPS